MQVLSVVVCLWILDFGGGGGDVYFSFKSRKLITRDPEREVHAANDKNETLFTTGSLSRKTKISFLFVAVAPAAVAAAILSIVIISRTNHILL